MQSYCLTNSIDFLNWYEEWMQNQNNVDLLVFHCDKNKDFIKKITLNFLKKYNYILPDCVYCAMWIEHSKQYNCDFLSEISWKEDFNYEQYTKQQ